MNDLPILALIFTVTAAVVFLALGVLSLFARERDPGMDPAPRLFGPLTPLVAALLPGTARGREVIAKDLLRAGYFEPVAPVNFRAVRCLLTYLPLVAGEVGAVMTDGRLAIAFMLVGVVGGVLGYALPRIFLSIAADRRTEQIRRGLPTLMDTMGLTLSTGASLPRAFQASGEAIRRGYPDLSQEVRVVGAQADMRSLSHALDKWKDRQPIPELGSLVFLLGQADRLGTDITRGLWELSASLQVTARQRAEAAANRANFYMTFPTVLCLLIAAGLILAGPGVVQLIESNREVEKILSDAKEQERKVRQQTDPLGKSAPTPPAPTPAPPPPPGL